MATREEAEVIAALLGFDRISRLYRTTYTEEIGGDHEYSVVVYRGDECWNVYGSSAEDVYSEFIEASQRQVYHERNEK